MRKVLLSVMMVSSLLAFNACKKGDQGPIGPKGDTGAPGAPGAAGAVGPAGATGAAGSKIIAGAVNPVAADGANGDFYFNTATRTLFGPKAAGAWPATGTALNGTNGANGATGATGATGSAGATGATGTNGTRILAGNGAPTPTNPTNAVEGDFYFDQSTGIFYGPRLANGTWGSNQMPLGSAYSAKTFVLTRGFENVTQTAKTFGQQAAVTYSRFDIISTYTVNSDDAVRIANYPGWSDNREMAFEDVAGSGIFNKVPTSGNQLDPTSGAFDADFSVGRRFIYTNNTANPTTTFVLTQTDVNRLTENNGAAFGYLTYAKVTTSPSNPGNNYTPANPNEVVTGGMMSFARNKVVTVTSYSGTSANYNATYTAQTKLDINNIPGLGTAIEKYKQDGKVFVKYRYFTPNAANSPVSHPGDQAGWIDLTSYANSYVKAVSYGADNTGTTGIVFPGPFTTTAYSTAGVTNVNPFMAAAANFMSSGASFGNTGSAVTVGTDQVATAINVTTGPVADRTTFSDGNIVINWTINSGTNFGNAVTTQSYGPTTIPSVTVSGNTGVRATPVARGFETAFYSAPQLTAVGATLSPTGTIDIVERTGGQPATYFQNTKLVQVSVFAIPGDVVKAAKAKGLDVNNLGALQAFANSL